MIGGLLKNRATGRYHYILFRWAPRPSQYGGKGPVRHKSDFHHTDGFDGRDKAIADGRAFCEANGFRWDDIGWSWSGEGIPAMTWEFIPHEPPPAGTVRAAGTA